MTAIASAYPSFSPRDRLQDILTSDIASGSIKSSDKDALASALDTIDGALGSQRSSASSGSRPDPSTLTSRISSLIGDQVSSGKLTEAQGKELQSVFDSFRSQSPGGTRGAGGPPPGPPPGADADGDADTSSSGSSSTSSASSASDPATLLKQLLAALKDGNGSSSSYGADGASSSSSLSLLLDYTA